MSNAVKIKGRYRLINILRFPGLAYLANNCSKIVEGLKQHCSTKYAGTLEAHKKSFQDV